MFKKPEKLKSHGPKVKLTEAFAPGQGDERAATPASSTSEPADGHGNPREHGVAGKSDQRDKPDQHEHEVSLRSKSQQADLKSTVQPRVKIEMPSAWTIIGLVTFLMTMSILGLFLFGPLVPVTNYFLQGQKQYALALAVLDNALRTNPNDLESMYQRAHTLQMLNMSKDALQQEDRLLATGRVDRPRLAALYAMRGEALMKLGGEKESLASLREAGRLDKSSATQFHVRAYLDLVSSDDPADAIKMETLALTIDPNLPKSCLNRSDGNNKTGHYQLAVDDCTRGLDLKVDWTKLPKGLREELLNNRSDAYYRLNDFKNSIKDAQDACAGNIKNATGTQDYPSERAYRSLVLSYLDSHQPAEALKVLDSVPKSVPPDGPLMQFRQEALTALNRKDEAKKAGPQTKDEQYEANRYFYGDTRYFYLAKDFEHTIGAATRSLRASPDSSWVLRMRGEAYSGLKQYGRAVDDFTKCLADKSAHPLFTADVYHLRSVAYQNLGQTDKAKADADQATRLGYQPEKPTKS